MIDAPRDRTRTMILLAAALLIVAHLALVVHGSSRHSAVFDEVVYPAAGLSYWSTGDYRLNAEHPPLLKLLTGLPWLGQGIDVSAAPGWEISDQWAVGSWVLYDDPQAAAALLARARLPIAALSGMLALGVFLMARRLGGGAAGLVALTLYAFDPLVVAHAGFATTDLGVACLLFFAAAALPGALSAGGSRLVLAGCLVGLALAAKFSALLLLPILAGLVALRLSEPVRVTLAARAAAVLLLAFVVVTLTYGLTGPGPYLRGLSLLRDHAGAGHGSYAFGLYGEGGWWWYFPAAWAVKTPIPLILATLTGVFVGWTDPRISRTRKWILLGVPALVVGSAVFSPLNIGVRHLLPAIPFFAVLGGLALPRVMPRGRVGQAVTALLVGWLVVGTLAVHPDELAYANEVAGGPDRTWRMLADSNVDWGQDLPTLAREVGRHPLRRLYLGYFGTADPAAHGLTYSWISSMRMIDRRYEAGPDPGGREWIAMSVTNLLEVNSVRHDDYGWLRGMPFSAFPGHSIALFDVTGQAEPLARLGRVAIGYRDWPTALAPLRRAAELRPDDGTLRLDLAQVFLGLGDRAAAARECRQATRILGPANTSSICGRGVRR